MTKRHLIYVDLPVVVMERTALVITDENDLKQQCAAREHAIRTQELKSKPERDKKGSLITYELNSDWDV